MSRARTKIERLKARHGHRWIAGALSELLAKLMRRSSIRRFMAMFFPEAKPEKFVFMTGCYNSGTTVVKDAICLHPAIDSPPIEGSAITTDLLDFDKGLFPRAMIHNAGALANGAEYRINSRRYRREIWPWWKGGVVFLDKSISNTPMMKNISAAFPGCYFINIIRDRQGTVDGIIKKSTPSMSVSDLIGESYSRSLLENQWAAMYEMVVDCDCAPGRFLNITFADFLAEPKEQVVKAWRFLGLEPCHIEYYENHLSVAGKTIHLNLKGSRKIDDEVYKGLLERLASKAEV